MNKVGIDTCLDTNILGTYLFEVNELKGFCGIEIVGGEAWKGFQNRLMPMHICNEVGRHVKS